MAEQDQEETIEKPVGDDEPLTESEKDEFVRATAIFQALLNTSAHPGIIAKGIVAVGIGAHAGLRGPTEALEHFEQHLEPLRKLSVSEQAHKAHKAQAAPDENLN